MDFLQHFLPSRALEENGHWSVGVQSAYYMDAGNLSIIAGVDAEYTEGFLTEFQDRPTIFSFTQGLHYDYEVSAVNLSGFTQASYKFSQRTNANFAVRIDSTFYDYDNQTNDGVVGRFLRLPDRSDSFVTASPKVSVQHEISANVSAYASYARGTRPPQTTDLYRLQINQTGDQARPEKIDAFDVGVRASNDFGTINLVGFYMDKKNFFFRDADGFNVANGKTRHVGVEADITVELHETLMVQSALTYAKHTYQFDRLTGNALESINSGNDVDTAPRVIANTTITWRPIERLRLEGEWRHVGDYYTDAANDNEYEGYDVLNIRGVAEITEEISVFLSLRNVADKLYAERADFAFGSDRFFPAEPRTLGFGLQFSH